MGAPLISRSPRMRFRPGARLRRPDEFQLCFTQGQRVHGRCFRLHITPSDAARLGLAVSRKVDKLAVVRNRIKRNARESFRHIRDRLPAADCVLVAKREAATATSDELRRDLAEIWRRATALKLSPPTGTMRDASTAAATSRAT